MSDHKELTPVDIKKIEDLASLANDLIEQENFKEAYYVVMKALEIVPEPHSAYAEATWLFATLGDIYFSKNDFEQALFAFTDAIQCPDGLGNPFIHLRLGQCQFERSNFDKAADEFMRAYMAEGKEIFQDEDPKYFQFLKSRSKVY